eukprot:scaffold2849_cov174-Amphora_coffeaeformis.AAC.1
MLQCGKMTQQQQQLLRFMVGDDVVFRRNDDNDDNGIGLWHAGTVEELWYRHAKWPDKRPSCPYRVEQKSQLYPSARKPNQNIDTKVVLIEQDTDAYIRVLKHSQRPTVPLLYGDVPLPEPKDPLEYLYRSYPKNDQLKMAHTLASWSNGNGKMELSKQFVDGSGIARLGTNTLFLPNSEDGKTYREESTDIIISYIVPRIEFRRPLSHIGNYNAEELFDSIFPWQKESSAKELEKNIRQLEIQTSSSQQPTDSVQRCQKLLNLGDAHLFLFRSMQCERDFEKANKCYRAAGFDWNNFKRDPHDLRGHAQGIPEASCAEATILHYSTERFVYSLMHNVEPHMVSSPGLERPMLDVDQILLEALGRRNNDTILGNISVTMSLLGQALHGGWYCKLAFLYGKALNNVEIRVIVDDIAWKEPNTKIHIQWLRDAHRNHQIKNQIQEEKMVKASFTQFGVPGTNTISAFAPKVVDILRSIPVDPQLDLHVSFFELQTYSYPVCALVFCPNTSVMEILQLPDELQLFPFSNGSFQWVWLRIAFIIHLGLRQRKNQFGDETQTAYQSRVRPGKIKLKCVGGDLQFASFLQLECFSIPGTLVELLEVDNDSEDEMGLHDEDRDACSAKLESGLRQLRQKEGMKHSFFLSKLKQASGSILTIMRQSSSNSTTERKNDLSNFYRESLNIKTRGNNAFK